VRFPAEKISSVPFLALHLPPMGSEKSGAAVAFERADEADLRVAGVAAAARIVRELAEGGARRIQLSVPGGGLAAATMADIRRLAPKTAVEIAGEAVPGATPAPNLSTREILRRTAKASDGPVSRWLNRPISQRLSAVLLLVPAIRPIHASIGTALIAAAMFAALLFGGPEGLVAGGLLFHAASVFDGVDGEIARATFRTSRLGATLDSVIDMATNGCFILGVTINLSERSEWAAPVGAWGFLLFLAGMAAITLSTAHQDKPFSMDLVKQRYRGRFPSPAGARMMRFLTIVSSRDFFALLFALLILAGIPMAVLYIFSTAATIWICFVVGAVASLRASPAERSA
jgi:1L-myo-inositol 1-phosphate cytidylyltransferase / CDP-L-myo-inositol myo-inositolphosphotransferase